MGLLRFPLQSLNSEDSPFIKTLRKTWARGTLSSLQRPLGVSCLYVACG